MSAEPYSASLVSRFAVPKPERMPQGYFRSKLFINSSTTNPLVAAAGPVFSLLERLCVSPSLPPIEHIRDNIEHELNAFYSKLSSQNYTDEFIIIARYLLSATIDELIGKNYLKLHGKPVEFKAFTPSSSDNEGPQRRFFDIVHHLKECANQYLDLLELAYYCLIAGFEGEQHLRPDGRQILDNLTEELFQLIQQYRANKPYRLFKEKNDLSPMPISNKPIFTVAILAFGILVSAYITSHLLLEHKAKDVLFGHTILASLDNNG